MSVKSIFESWCRTAWFEEEECHLNKSIKLENNEASLTSVYQNLTFSYDIKF